jgi:hypothetical protein
VLSVLVQLTDSDYGFWLPLRYPQTFLPHSWLSTGVCNKSITTGATYEAGTGNPFGAPECTPGFYWGSCYSIFSFICMLCRSLFVFCPFLLVIVLSVLLFIDADYHFGIFNLFSLPKSKITDVVSHLPDDGMLIISHITITLHVLGLLAIFCPCYCTIGKPHMHLLFEETMNDQCAKAPVSVELTIILTLCVLFLNWNFFL